VRIWSVRLKPGIPEDDPRNPAVIADNVGDNVGDCAGMAADLFETYAVTVVAAMLIASSVFTTEFATIGMMLPLVIGALCIIASIAGTFFVRFTKTTTTVMGALYRGFIASAVFSALFITALIIKQVGLDTELTLKAGGSISGQDLLICGAVGLGVTGLLVWITEYYTSTKFRPVREIAKSSETGHGTNIIQGLAVSLESTALPVIVICVGLSLLISLVVSTELRWRQRPCYPLRVWLWHLMHFGPVTDNAGGIAEMAGLPDNVRKVTDELDAVGNTTKAVTKGYAIGSAGLAALCAVRWIYRRNQTLPSEFG
jgi:K(+)-stimulated pyrophosphate-energized sodium pump